LILLVGYVSYVSSTDALKKHSYDLVNQYQQSAISEILRTLNRYELLAKTLHSNVGIQQLMAPVSIEPFEEFMTIRTTLNPIINVIFDASDSGINIQMIRYHDYNSEIIYGNAESLLEYVRRLDYYLNDGVRQFQVVNFNRVEGLQWLEDVRELGAINLWKQVGYDKEYNYISLINEITRTSRFVAESVGLLRLTVMFNTIYSEDMSDTDRGFNLIFNENMELLSAEPEKIEFFDNNMEFLRTFSESAENEAVLNGQDLLVLKSQIFANDWYIISVFPMFHITDNVNMITTTILISFVIAGILLFLLTYFISNSFSKRINFVATQMQYFNPGSPGTKISVSAQDEIGLLGKKFNEMTEQISALIQDNYQSNIDKKEALLKALQAQINPHLLYNSLSAVGRLADLGETDEINRMIRALTIFYRLTLSKGHEVITIENELAHVEAFIEIFRIRIGEMFNVTYNIDNEVLKYHTIKVILQPFVENIFEHALNIDDSIINIFISAQAEDDSIRFIIADDGVGIARDKLDLLFTMGLPDSYGVANVDERIRLQFGPDYGVNITSTPGAGTKVDILIPKKEYIVD